MSIQRDPDNDHQLSPSWRAIRDTLIRGLSSTDDLANDLEPLFLQVLLEADVREHYKPVPGIHPSSLGGCKRKGYYELRGEERQPSKAPDPHMKLRMRVSTALHKWVQGDLVPRDPGFVAVHEARLPEENGAHLRGQADTVFSLVSPSGEVQHLAVFDYKFVSADQYGLISRPDKKHVKQVTAYMFGLPCPAGYLLYFNKNTTDFKIFSVPFQQEVLDEILAEVTLLLDAVQKEEPPEREVDFFVCKNICEYTWICNPQLRRRKL